MIILLCGESGSGKTYLINRLIAELEIKCSGFFTKKEERTPDGIESVYLHPAEGERVYTKENRVADTLPEQIRKIPYSEVFDTLGVKLLTNIPEQRLVIMDELGFLESKAQEFCAKVLETLQSGFPVLGVIKERSTPFLDSVRSLPGIKLYMLDVENREELYKEIYFLLKEALDEGHIQRRSE